MRNLKKLFSKKNIAIITCYDATFASFLSKTSCDALLVGDSLGVLIKGQSSTREVKIDDVIYHTESVRRGAPVMPIISDMPINSFLNNNMALKNAKLLIEAGADMVKIEGYDNILEIIKHLSKHKIPVCGHIGSMPQINNIQNSVNGDLLTKAKNLEDAGAKMIVMSMTSISNDKNITNQLSIPTISFRSSSFCDGKVELLYDLLGITSASLSNDKNDGKKIMPSNMVNKIEKFIKKIHNRKTQ
jgi:3-methyl-2-oxobutanoate hydroxymethyltransferase